MKKANQVPKFNCKILCTEVVLKTVKDAKMAQLEILSLTTLSHIPHIAKLLNSYPSQSSLSSQAPALDESMVLVFPQYQSLPCKKLDLFQIATYSKQLAEILKQVHASAFVHLDISPKNLMMDDDSHPVLIDFGLSKRVGATHLPGCGTYSWIYRSRSF